MSEILPAPASSIGPSPLDPAPAAPNPSLLDVFLAFSTIAISGFGGVLYWSRRVMVERRKWLTSDEFNEVYALCNFLPGPNIVNFSVVFGRRFRGTAGAMVALVGLLAPPMAMALVFAALYAHYGTIDTLQRMFMAVAAAAAGLTFSTTLRMTEPLMRRPFGAPQLMAVGALVGVGVLRWPIYYVLGVLIPLSIGLAWWSRRR